MLEVSGVGLPMSVSRLASLQKALELVAQSANATDAADVKRCPRDDHDDDDEDVPNSSISSSCSVSILPTRFILDALKPITSRTWTVNTQALPILKGDSLFTQKSNHLIKRCKKRFTFLPSCLNATRI